MGSTADVTNTAFSASGEDAITRALEVSIDRTATQLSRSEFEEFYEIDRTVNEITQGKFTRVALQFPDELLHDSVPIYRLLKRRLGEQHELYVLADTSYGSCCVDEVAAQHVDADAVVHYGHACMSQTYRLPVIYIFGKKSIDVDDCVARLIDILDLDSNRPSIALPIVLRHDVAYSHAAETIVTRLRDKIQPYAIPFLYHEVPARSDPPTLSDASNEDAKWKLVLEKCTILYIGTESLGLTNLIITHSSCEVFSYDPEVKAARKESGRTNKLLMRRYAVVQRARDADVFGILVGTLGVASYLPLISHIRKLLARARKKSYTISVGKLNPAKLANFMEIECFVLVACPENSVIDAKEFFRPIVTPYELEVALQPEMHWNGQYILDFEELLAHHRGPENDERTTKEEREDPDQPVFSLVTGKYRHARRYGDTYSDEDTGSNPGAIILRNQDGRVARLSDNAAAQFLQSRTYRGLEARVGEDQPSVLEQGRSGIARGYTDDHK